jgi:hypothetical protein
MIKVRLALLLINLLTACGGTIQSDDTQVVYYATCDEAWTSFYTHKCRARYDDGNIVPLLDMINTCEATQYEVDQLSSTCRNAYQIYLNCLESSRDLACLSCIHTIDLYLDVCWPDWKRVM